MFHCMITALPGLLMLTSKSKVLVFRSSNRINSNLKFNYGSREIEIVNSYKYLGVEITLNLSYLKHFLSKIISF